MTYGNQTSTYRTSRYTPRPDCAEWMARGAAGRAAVARAEKDAADYAVAHTPTSVDGEPCYRDGDRWIDPATGFVVAE